MGSFNETCALSCLPITCGDPVKLLFLTRNPYATTCDERFAQRFAQRGCYHNDQWFVRTPPINGQYADYGKCDFEESYTTKLIEKTFSIDVVELPFGYNEYHAPPVPANPNIHQLLEAAWEGRLLVRDGDSPKPKVPDNFPTWKKIHALLKEHKFPIMHEENRQGYNAQDAHYGIVTVYWNEYADQDQHLDEIIPLLSKDFDVKKHTFGMENVLLVVPKSGFENLSIFFDDSKIKSILENPKPSKVPKILPVLAVMIRQDVWDLFKNAKFKRSWIDQDLSIEGFKHKAKKLIDSYIEQSKNEFMKFFNTDIRSIPYQTSLAEHFKQIPNLPLPTESELEELTTNCGELTRVEMIMSSSNHSWNIPSTSGQETNWKIQKEINGGFAKIAQTALKIEKDQ